MKSLGRGVRADVALVAGATPGGAAVAVASCDTSHATDEPRADSLAPLPRIVRVSLPAIGDAAAVRAYALHACCVVGAWPVATVAACVNENTGCLVVLFSHCGDSLAVQLPVPLQRGSSLRPAATPASTAGRRRASAVLKVAKMNRGDDEGQARLIETAVLLADFERSRLDRLSSRQSSKRTL